jgi:periplasmic protein TonB
MNSQAKAFQISFLFHGAIIALVIMCSTFMGHYKKAIILDFDMRKPEQQVRKYVDLTPAPVVAAKPESHSTKDNEPPKMTKESVHATSVPETPPIVKLPEARNLDSTPMGQEMQDKGKTEKEGSPGVAGTGTGTGDAGGGSAGARYLSENYAYIRDKILKNIIYPDLARRKDWEGKVILSFIITAEGSVRDFRIVQSSGYKMLDKSAVETVRDAAPFPRPPVEAQMVIPIIYRLE